jgi:hypothetical protein|tara:strand:+ start:246 stop:605 length:360 start_codon:yes stop_codon:yes gene_type:complete
VVSRKQQGEKALTVYITQEVRGRDITDAAMYGDLQILVPAKEQVAFSTQPTVRRITRGLRNFNDNDYLLASGDPVTIGIACAVASANNVGRFKILKWDRLEEKYFPLYVNLYQKNYKKE